MVKVRLILKAEVVEHAVGKKERKCIRCQRGGVKVIVFRKVMGMWGQ